MSKLKGSKARSSRSTSKCSVLLEKLEPLAHSILGSLDKLSTRVDEISSRVDGQLELKLTRLFDLLQNERNPLSSNLGLRYGADTITYLDILSLLARKKITVPGDDLKKFTRAIQDRVMDCLKAHYEGNNGDEEEEGYEAVREEIERALEVGNRDLGSFEQYGFSSQLLSPYMPRLIVPSDDDDEESEEEEVDVSKESLRIFEDISAFGCSLARGGGGGQDDDHDGHEETVTRSVDGPDSKKNTTVKNPANYEESSFLDSALSSSPVILKGGMLKGVSRRDARRDCKRLDFDALVSPVQEGSSSPAGKSRWSDAAFRAEKFREFQEAEKKKNKKSIMKKEEKDRVEEDDETDDDGEEDDKTLVAKVKGKGEKLAEVEVIPKKAAAKGKSVASASSGPSTSTGTTTTSTTSGGPNKRQSKRLKSRSTTSSSSSALPISTASTTTTTTLRKLPTLSDLSLPEESGVEVQDHSTEDPGLNVGVPSTMSDPIQMNPNRANGSTRMSESSRSLRKRKEKVDYKAMSSSGKPKRSSKKR